MHALRSEAGYRRPRNGIKSDTSARFVGEARLSHTVSAVLRLGFGQTVRQARQLVSHGHVLVDGRRLNVPSAAVRPGQTIACSASARNFVSVREAMEVMPDPPPYLERDKDAVSGRLVRQPERSEIPLTVQIDERLIVELMS